MRTPNVKCQVCQKPLYRKPSELKKYNGVCCIGCRSIYYKSKPVSANLALGRVKGLVKKGHIHSIKERLKRSKSLANWCKNNPDKVKQRGMQIRAENHYRWKGGVSKINKAIRLTTENRKWSLAVRQRDKSCSHCGAKKNLDADHIIPLATLLKTYNITTVQQARKCKELWDINNGRTLCKRCHCIKDKRKYSPAGMGRRQKYANNNRTIIQENARRD